MHIHIHTWMYIHIRTYTYIYYTPTTRSMNRLERSDLARSQLFLSFLGLGLAFSSFASCHRLFSPYLSFSTAISPSQPRRRGHSTWVTSLFSPTSPYITFWIRPRGRQRRELKILFLSCFCQWISYHNTGGTASPRDCRTLREATERIAYTYIHVYTHVCLSFRPSAFVRQDIETVCGTKDWPRPNKM